MEAVGVIIVVLALLFFFVYIPVVIIRWVVRKFEKLKKNNAGYQEESSAITKKTEKPITEETAVKPTINTTDVTKYKSNTGKSPESTENYQDDKMKPNLMLGVNNMKLETAGHISSANVTNEELIHAFQDDTGRGDFIILIQNDQVFIQAASKYGDPCIFDSVEYYEGNDNLPFQSTQEVSKETVQAIFTKYLNGDISWKKDIEWKKQEKFNYKTASKEELKYEYNRIAAELGDDQFFTKKELNYLPEILQDGEQILAFSSGLMNNNTWLISLTDRRIIFLNKGMIYGLKQEVIPLNRVNAVSGSTGLIFGKIIITDGAKDREITNVWKKTVRLFTNKCQDAIHAINQNQHQVPQQQPNEDPYAKLEKLASLKQKGIITEDEFEKEKKKILG